MPTGFTVDDSLPTRLDDADPLRAFRNEFAFPSALARPDGAPCIYLTGNSLGLMPKAARALVDEELDDWSRLAVEAHFESRRPWFSYHELFRDLGARLVGARRGEVVMMNSLTVNLHLMMASFYRPTPSRFRIVIEDGAFPSDHHAVASQARFHGLDPAKTVIGLKPRPGERLIREEDIEALFQREGGSIALLMLGGVNFATGQLFDMPRITRAAHAAGAVAGFDLAHAAGNVPLSLHDWNIDFAVWCSYKYLNSGPGAVAGCFVHENHWRPAADRLLPRFEGWWGHDPATRFRMAPEFVSGLGAEAWQLSNPPILAMAPLKASLEIFDRAGMASLREKSKRLTAYLEFMLRELLADRIEIITPTDPDRRGAQLSVVVKGVGREILGALRSEGVICDFREPSVVRMAPAPLYCSFRDCRDAAMALKRLCGA